jgi:hypothetical protein
MTQTITRSVVSCDHHVDIVPNAMAALWRPSMLKEFWDVVQTVGTWSGAAIMRDRSGVCLSLNGVRLGHLNWNGRLVLPFGPEIRDELVAPRTANLDPDPADIGRSIFHVQTAADVNRALFLFRFAYLIADSKQDTCTMVAAQQPLAQL